MPSTASCCATASRSNASPTSTRCRSGSRWRCARVAGGSWPLRASGRGSDGSSSERGRQAAPLLARQAVATGHSLHEDLVGARFAVLLDTCADRVLVAPGHQRVHEPVAAAAAGVVIAEAE